MQKMMRQQAQQGSTGCHAAPKTEIGVLDRGLARMQEGTKVTIGAPEDRACLVGQASNG